MAIDPIALALAGVNNATSGLSTLAGGQLAMAQQENQRAYRNALIEAERRFARENREDQQSFIMQRDETLRQNRKSDETETRRRLLENQLSALGFQGDMMKLSEADLSREVAKRTRERQITIDNEDFKRRLEQAIEANRAKRDADLRAEAAEAGIAADESIPIGEVGKALALAKVQQEVALSMAAVQEGVKAVHAVPEYRSGLRPQLASKLLERNQLILESTMPLPVFNPQMTPEEQAFIWNEIARDPRIQQELSKLPNGQQRLAALQNGDFLSAIDGIPKKVADRLANEWQLSAPAIEQRILDAKGGNYSAGVRAYLERLRTLSDRLARVDRDIDQLYELGAKSGVNFGLALRLEDPDALMAEFTQQMPQQEETPVGTQNQLVPQTPPASVMPLEGAAASGASHWLLPFIGEQARNLGAAYTQNPLMRQGMNNLATAGIQVVDAAGQLWGMGKAGLTGGQRPPPLGYTPIDPLVNAAQGVAQIGMSPLSTVGESAAYLFAPTSPVWPSPIMPKRQEAPSE